jgi:peptide-methionine (S)-S-oxide reductase
MRAAALITLLFCTGILMSADKPTKPAKMEVATLGGGCFWCLEAVFERLDGVHKVVSGYAGGKTLDPTYREICKGTTGHAEVVQIHFNPKKIGYDQILSVFWQCHDPTTLNRQGNDFGTQYRSTIMPHDKQQTAIAEQSRKEWAKEFKQPIVTTLEPLKKFYIAEVDHQDYFRLNPGNPYCAFLIEPKLKALESKKIIPARPNK